MPLSSGTSRLAAASILTDRSEEQAEASLGGVLGLAGREGRIADRVAHRAEARLAAVPAIAHPLDRGDQIPAAHLAPPIGEPQARLARHQIRVPPREQLAHEPAEIARRGLR